MIIEPRVRGFICTTAHPVGCARNVRDQISYVLRQGSLPQCPKRVAVLGCSTGYGLASRIVATFAGSAEVIGVSLEREPSASKTGSAGWYNNRAFEIEAIRKVFGTGDKCPPISATKALTGHSLGATGVQEAIYSILMMNNGFVCESAHITELDPAFADMPIVRKRIDNAKLGTVLSNSFGFGGTNATLVFKRLDA